VTCCGKTLSRSGAEKTMDRRLRLPQRNEAKGLLSASGRTIADSFALRISAVICLAPYRQPGVFNRTMGQEQEVRSRWAQRTRTLRMICLHAKRKVMTWQPWNRAVNPHDAERVRRRGKDEGDGLPTIRAGRNLFGALAGEARTIARPRFRQGARARRIPSEALMADVERLVLHRHQALGIAELLSVLPFKNSFPG